MAKMRLSGREVGPEGIREIVEASRVVRIGACDEEGIFVVPVNFGFEWISDDGATDGESLVIYIHSAREGRKARAFAGCPEVAVEMDVDLGLVEGSFACSYSNAYRSVMGKGVVYPVEERDEKVRALSLLMDHVAPGSQRVFSDEAVEGVAVFRIDVSEITGKARL